jgi:probable addiction module antidote protein
MAGLDLEKELHESLKDPKEAAAYLQAAILEADPDNWLIALRTLAQAKGGLSLLAQKTGLHRVHLYRMLGKGGNPTFKNVLAILTALGVQVNFSQVPDKHASQKRVTHFRRGGPVARPGLHG